MAVLKKLILSCTSVGMGLCGLLWLSLAYADCNALDSNDAWRQGFNQLSSAYKQKEWKVALNQSRQLEEICDLSPALNYTIAKIYQNMGDDEKYLFYLQKATLNTEKMVVDKDMLDQMWADKFLAAHPEATQDNIEARKRQILKLQSELLDSYRTLDARSYEIQTLKNELEVSRRTLEDNITLYKNLTWIGTGIGAGGIVMTSVGVAMVLMSEPFSFSQGFASPNKYKEDIVHALGWTFIGMGSALTVTGAVLAGVYGYKYMHNKDNVDLAFEVFPTSVTLKIVFQERSE